MKRTTNRFLIFLGLKAEEIWGVLSDPEMFPVYWMLSFFALFIGIAGGTTSSIYLVCLSCYFLIFWVAGICIVGFGIIILALIWTFLSWLWENWKKAGRISKTRKADKKLDA